MFCEIVQQIRAIIIIIMSLLFNIVLFVILLALLTVASFALFLVRRRRQYSHFPGPPIKSFFKGHIDDFGKNMDDGNASDHLLLEWHKMYGKVICTWFYHIPFLSVVDPDLVKEILVTRNLTKSENAYSTVASVYGERFLGHGLATEIDHQKWSVKRKIFNPAFHRKCLKDMMPAFNASADLFIEKLLKVADGQREITMADELSKVTLDVIFKVAFGMDMNIINDPDCKFSNATTEALEAVADASFRPFGWMNPLNWSYQSKVRSSVRFLRETGKRVLQVRKLAMNHGEQVPNDILQHTLALAEEDPSVTVDDMLDEFITFFIAGHETTANKLAFCLLELADHEEIEDRLVQEVFKVLGDKTSVEFDDLAKMHQIGEALKETLRLYPTATGTLRTTKKEEILGGYRFPAGAAIMVSSYVAGRFPEFWSNADDFNPLRFEEDEAASRSHFTYFPFSLGPRNCIGQHFAQIEAKVILSRFLQTFKFKLAPGQTKKIAEVGTLRPRDGVVCTLIKRKQ